jgi:ATPase subunit of ABC transporter with duplicated ATPase domains
LIDQHPPLECSNVERNTVSFDHERSLLGLPLDAAPGHLSHGELRKLHLLAARQQRSGILLLDEPSQDLDDQGVDWLLSWLRSWEGALLTVTHDRRVLRRFRALFLVREAGCRCLEESYDEPLA